MLTEIDPGGAATLDAAIKTRYEANANTNAFTDAEQTKLASLANYTTEQAQDAVGAMVGVSIIYDDTSNTLQRAALTGDVTSPLNSNATTIAADAVGNTKLANMAANTIKGNNTGVAADPADLTATQITAMLNAFTTALKGLVPPPVTVAGKYLKDDGTWATPGQKYPVTIALSDRTSSLVAGIAKETWRAPFACTISALRAYVDTAPTGATSLAVDMNKSGVSMLSTKLVFDASEKTTFTALIPHVFSSATLAADEEVTWDIDTVGSTIAGVALKVSFVYTEILP